MTVAPSRYLIAAGSNLGSEAGDPEGTVRAGLKNCECEGLRLVACSRLYHTPCFPAGAGPDYVNAAALVEAVLEPAEVLAALHRVEARFGRERVQRWGQRTLDLDLLAAGDRVLPDAETQTRWRGLPPDDQIRKTPDRLVLPHPRIQDRAFVLVPLLDIAPGWRHPITGLSVAEMVAALPETARAEVVALPDATGWDSGESSGDGSAKAAVILPKPDDMP